MGKKLSEKVGELERRANQLEKLYREKLEYRLKEKLGEGFKIYSLYHEDWISGDFAYFSLYLNQTHIGYIFPFKNRAFCGTLGSTNSESDEVFNIIRDVLSPAGYNIIHDGEGLEADKHLDTLLSEKT